MRGWNLEIVLLLVVGFATVSTYGFSIESYGDLMQELKKRGKDFRRDDQHGTLTIPTEIGHLTKMTSLHIEDEALVGSLPTELNRLSNLKVLSLNGGKFEGRFPKIERLKKLNILRIQSQDGLLDFDGLTNQVQDFGDLTHLVLRNFMLSDFEGLVEALPSENLKQLRLEQRYGPFEELHSDLFARFKVLEDLSLMRSGILGSLPSSMFQLAHLKLLDVSRNFLNGTISSDFYKLSHLTYLNIGRNELTGAIPAEALKRLTNLKFLSLFKNQLTGQIPSTLERLTLLTSLGLGSNSFGGPIPDHLWKLTNLQYLNAQEAFTGTIGPEIGQLSNLIELHFHGDDTKNVLRGTIPEEIGALTSLVELGLFRNEFKGTIPRALGRLTKLTYLGLFDNSLQGTIPQQIGRLSMLRELELSYNRLSGSLPMSMGNLTQLNELYLEGNQLTGVDETVLQRMDLLQVLSIGKNQFTQFPTFVFNMTSLLELDISGKQLQNMVPKISSGLSKLSSLTTLNVGGLQFPCDCGLNTWFVPFVQRKGILLEDEYVTCDNSNAFSGNPISRIKIAQDSPCETATNIRARVTSFTASISWFFKVDNDYPQIEGILLERSCLYITKRDFKNGFHPRTAFNFTLFEVEFFVTSEERFSERTEKRCSSKMDITLDGLSPYMNYTFKISKVFVQLDPEEYLFANQLVVKTGPASKGITVQTNQFYPLDSPRGIANSSQMEDSFTMQWNPPNFPRGQITSYHVQAFDKDEQLIWDQPTSRQFMTISGLSVGQPHKVRVRARTHVDFGPWSENVTVWTRPHCQPGRYRHDVVCLPCEKGSYSTGESVCTKCVEPFPTTLGMEATGPDMCVAAAGHYSAQLSDGEKVRKVCPSEYLVCDAEGSNVSNLLIKNGFWRVSNSTDDIRACPNRKFCQSSVTKEATTARQCAGFSDANSSSCCAQGHHGVYCLECLPGYAMRSTGCELCSSKDLSLDSAALWGFIIFIIILLCAPAITTTIFSCRATKTKQSGDDDDDDDGTVEPSKHGKGEYIREKVKTIAEKATNWSQRFYARVGVKLRIWISFLQIALVLVSASFSRMKTIQHATNGIVVALNLDFSPLYHAVEGGCYFKANFYHMLLVGTLGPIVCFVLMYVVLIFMKCCFGDSTFQRAKSLAVWLTLQICFFIYIGVSSQIVKAFWFERFPTTMNLQSGHVYEVLKADRSILYNSDESANFRIYAIFMVLIYPIGIVVLFAAMTRAYHNALKKVDFDATKVTSSTRGARFLVEAYNDRFYYFESIELLRKFASSGMFLVIFNKNEVAGLISFSFVNVFALLLVLQLRPYKREDDHMYACICLFTLFSLHYLTQTSPPDTFRNTVYGASAVITLIFLVLVGRDFYLSRRRSNESRNRGSTGSSVSLPDQVEHVLDQDIIEL